MNENNNRFHFSFKDDKKDVEIFDSKEEKKETKEIKEDDSKPVNKKLSRFYFSFRLRVILLIVGILVLFSAASFMIIFSLRNNEIVKVKYNESSKVHYDVCSQYDDRVVNDCLPENREYNANNSVIVRTNFNYKAIFEENVDYDLSYYVVLVNKIYDPFDPEKVYYENEETLVDNTSINDGEMDFSINIDFQKYNAFVKDYLSKYSVVADASLDAILYVNDGTDTRIVGRINIPLNEDKFEIHTDSLSKEQRIYYHTIGEWTNTNTFYVVFGSFLIVLSLLLLSYLTRLVLKITVKKSKYQQKLSSILNEYNHYIVNSDGDYHIDNKKRIIKVASFEELLDARNILNKPIIYSKINNIKSLFVVEDSEIIYRYIIKEADMEE